MNTNAECECFVKVASDDTSAPHITVTEHRDRRQLPGTAGAESGSGSVAIESPTTPTTTAFDPTTPTTTEYTMAGEVSTTTTTTPEPNDTNGRNRRAIARARRETTRARRFCTDEEEFFLATDGGRYVLVGPPSEGWIITGDTKGWWERFLVRRCTRDSGGFVYLLKSRAHDRYLRATEDGTVSIQREFAGVEEEFTLEEDIENGSSEPTYFRTWDGKYLAISPNGGLLSVRKYYAQRFGLEKAPPAEDDVTADALFRE